jgi:hypothetical protein
MVFAWRPWSRQNRSASFAPFRTPRGARRSYATSAFAALSASPRGWWNACIRLRLSALASSDSGAPSSPSTPLAIAARSAASLLRKGESRLSVAATATAAARHPRLPVARAVASAAARSILACRGAIGSAAIRRPSGVSTPGSASHAGSPCWDPCSIAPRVLSVRSALRSAASSGGVMNGNLATRSTPMARSRSATPSTGAPRIAGAAWGRISFSKCAEEKRR